MVRCDAMAAMSSTLKRCDVSCSVSIACDATL